MRNQATNNSNPKNLWQEDTSVKVVHRKNIWKNLSNAKCRYSNSKLYDQQYRTQLKSKKEDRKKKKIKGI